MSIYLFVYGTLLLPGNPFGNELALRGNVISRGTVVGILYDTGEYPALFSGSGVVHGMVYAFDDKALLALLDEYEGVGPDEEQPNLYKRKEMDVTTDDGLVTAWTYIYNRPAEGLTMIYGGDYLKYLAQKNPPGS